MDATIMFIVKLVVVITFAAIALALYMLPTIIAGIRDHHQTGAILILNLLGGWTVLAWLGALIWACSAIPPWYRNEQMERKARQQIERALVALALAGAITFAPSNEGAAVAEPLPVQRPAGPGGSCPHGYFTSGSFCVPSQGAQDAIPKPPNGTCPWGWTSSGSYCLRSGSGGRP